MWEVFQFIADNVAMQFSNVVLLMFNIGLLMFFARGFKEGSIVMLLVNGLFTIWFFKEGWAWQYPMILMFVSIVMMCFSLFFIGQAADRGVA